ncbi:unnamed protein product [Cuscuta europaea]|uniref:Transposase (putative) gypsy type domain-containing protein n=1 Tax=Cuscuta europaea TaxID=41803 RepID=A0A9P0YPE2_CUSEU|nr:unnamed protein product [Cuscuta europaea]
MSSASDSQDISGEASVNIEVASDVESSSEQLSVIDDRAVAEAMQDDLQLELEAEDFEQVNADEELAMAYQVAEDEAQKEGLKVTVAVPPPRRDTEAGSSRPLDAVPLSVAPGKKRKKMRTAPKKKQAAVDAGQPVGLPEGYSFLNTAALEVKNKATRGEMMAAQFLVGPSAQVVEPKPDDVLLHAPEGCFAVHLLSVEPGLRFPLHPFVLEYLRFVKLAPCQLTLNSHSYLAGFLSLCLSRKVPLLWSNSFCRSTCVGGVIRMPGAMVICSSSRSSGFLTRRLRLTRGGKISSATSVWPRTLSPLRLVIGFGGT